jgi:hypothetical protein
MTDPPEPLDPKLRALLDAERDSPGPRADVSSRLLDRLGTSIGTPSTGGGGDPHDGSSGGASQAAGAGSAAAKVGGLSLAKALAAPITWAVFAAGAAVGAGAHAVLAPPPTPEARVVTVTVSVPVPQAPTAPLAPASSAPDVPSAPASAPRVATSARASTDDEGGRDRALAEENALITRAQSALARQQVSLALAALNEHRRRFPNGQLVDEREILAARANALAKAADGGAP